MEERPGGAWGIGAGHDRALAATLGGLAAMVRDTRRALRGEVGFDERLVAHLTEAERAQALRALDGLEEALAAAWASLRLPPREVHDAGHVQSLVAFARVGLAEVEPARLERASGPFPAPQRAGEVAAVLAALRARLRGLEAVLAAAQGRERRG